MPAETSRTPVEGHTPDCAQRSTPSIYIIQTLVRAARKLHFSARIENCSNTKQLFSVSNGLLSKSKTTPLPSDIPHSALQDRFCMFLSQKFQNIRQDLMLTLRNQQHSLPMMVLNSDFSSLSQKRRFVNSLLNRLPKPAC